MSTVNYSLQKLDISDVRQVVVSDIVTDTDGTFVRAVRFYGDPVVASTPTLLLEVVTRSPIRTDLVVATPAAGF